MIEGLIFFFSFTRENINNVRLPFLIIFFIFKFSSSNNITFFWGVNSKSLKSVCLRFSLSFFEC